MSFFDTTTSRPYSDSVTICIRTLGAKVLILCCYDDYLRDPTKSFTLLSKNVWLDGETLDDAKENLDVVVGLCIQAMIWAIEPLAGPKTFESGDWVAVASCPEREDQAPLITISWKHKDQMIGGRWHFNCSEDRKLRVYLESFDSYLNSVRVVRPLYGDHIDA